MSRMNEMRIMADSGPAITTSHSTDFPGLGLAAEKGR